MAGTLEHHGILGQKWGVRRYQNKDGSLTAEGKRRAYNIRNIRKGYKYIDDINKIYDSLSDEEKFYLYPGGEGRKFIEDPGEIENVIYTVLEKYGDTPASFTQLYYDDRNGGMAEIATATDPRYRGRGLSTLGYEKVIKYMEKYGATKIKNLEVWINEANKPSTHVAEKVGLQLYDKDSAIIDGKKEVWNKYIYKNRNYKG